MTNKRCQVSFDLETLGASADSVILSIGAVATCVATGERIKFYAACSVESQSNRQISQSTLRWWEGQSAEAREALDFAKSDDCPSLQDSLNRLADWLGLLGQTHDVYVWGNGSDFDVAMLNHAYKQISDFAPWNFRHSRDMRTLYDITLRFGLDIRSNIPPVGVAHNALDDAEFQANVIVESLRQLDLVAEFIRGPQAEAWAEFLASKNEAHLTCA